jgi:uncharacterized membrane protein
MDSRTKLFGHAVHPMLIPFPLGLLTAAVIFDVIDRLRDSGSWEQTSSITMVAGLIGGVVAAPFGLRDWLALPGGTRAKRIGLWHAGANVVALVLFFISWLLHRDDPSAASLVLGLAGLAVATVGAWFGGELIDRLGVGVNRGMDLNAPSSLSQEPIIKV